MAKTTYGSSHPKLTLWVSSLWAGVCLLLALGFLLFAGEIGVQGLPLASAGALLHVAYVLCWIAVLMMSALAVLTVPNPRGHEWEADFASLPAALRWPLKLGGWLGASVAIFANLWLILTSQGYTSTPGGNARFAMSLMSIIGAIGALLFSIGLALPGAALLVILWLTALVLFFLRGMFGLFAWVPGTWRKSAWKERG